MVKESYSEEEVNIIRLARTNNIGSRTFQQLMKMFKTASNALNNLRGFSSKWNNNSNLRICTQREALHEIEQTKKYGASIITYTDSCYPQLLLEIYNFPIVLTYKGRVHNLQQSNKIAIVGSRNCSINGKIFTRKLVEDLVYEGFTTVSGMAIGIDAEVHRNSIKHTIAVLAGGIDHIYPFANKALYEEIAQNSVIITELPFGVKAIGKNFPQRNRIISGIALGSVIIEANIKSGSLITARFALEQSREVFAVPGFPLDIRSMGTNKLIKSGEAYLLESIDDILLQINMEKEIKEKPSPELLTHAELDVISENDRKKILSILSSNEVTYADIHHETEIPMKIIYTICLELEINGQIRVDELTGRISLVYT